MTHGTAQIVQQLLVDLGLGTLRSASPSGAWPVFRGVEPDLPDNAITVYGTVGLDDGRSMIDGELFDQPGFQVRVRGTDGDVAVEKVEAIRTSLAVSVRLRDVRVEAATYLVWSVSRIGQVLVLGLETPKSKRSLCTLNAQLAVRER